MYIMYIIYIMYINMDGDVIGKWLCRQWGKSGKSGEWPG